MENQNNNFNGPFQQNNMDQNQNPYTLDNPYYNKKQFKKMLLGMSEDQRESFIANLPQDFVNSSRMPSLKSKVTLILLAIFLGGLGVDRFYRGKIGTGVLKLMMVVILLIFAILGSIVGLSLTPVLVVDIILGTRYVYVLTKFGWFCVIVVLLSLIAMVIWIITDIILSAVGKATDKQGRRIDF